MNMYFHPYSFWVCVAYLFAPTFSPCHLPPIQISEKATWESCGFSGRYQNEALQKWSRQLGALAAMGEEGFRNMCHDNYYRWQNTYDPTYLWASWILFCKTTLKVTAFHWGTPWAWVLPISLTIHWLFGLEVANLIYLIFRTLLFHCQI
jgi:hypothetical protein